MWLVKCHRALVNPEPIPWYWYNTALGKSLEGQRECLYLPVNHEIRWCQRLWSSVSVSERTFPPNTLLSFISDHHRENKIQGFWGRKELLKRASHFYSPFILLIQNRRPKIYSCRSGCRKGDPENTQLPWVNLTVIFKMYYIIPTECRLAFDSILLFSFWKTPDVPVAREESSVKGFASSLPSKILITVGPGA